MPKYLIEGKVIETNWDDIPLPFGKSFSAYIIAPDDKIAIKKAKLFEKRKKGHKVINIYKILGNYISIHP